MPIGINTLREALVYDPLNCDTLLQSNIATAYIIKD